MRYLVSLFLAVVASTWCTLAWAEPVPLQALSGQWHQTASNAGKCDNCQIMIEMNGQNFIVKASNGWSAVAHPSFQGKPFVAGKGSWKPNFGGAYGGKAFYLNLGMVGDKLLMLMTVPGPDGRLRNIKATFEKAAPSGEAL